MGGFDRSGEELAGLGKGVVAPIEKWADILGMLETAAQFAANEFHKAGAPRDITLTEENVQVQEYYLSRQVVFLFWLPIKGEDYYYNYSFKLGPQVIAELAVTGKWPIVYAAPTDMRAN
jgi:hypothetical protein